MPDKRESRFVTIADMARLIGKSYMAVFRAVRDGRIKSVKFGGSVRIPKSEAARILKEGY